MIDKLQNFVKWAGEQMFKTNPPKIQHMDHVIVQETITKKPKRKYTRKTKDVTNQ